MEPIEIRLNPTRLIFSILMLLIPLGAGTYYIYFSGKFHKTTELFDIMSLLMLAFIAYFLYHPIRMLINKEPILTLTRTDITINQRRKPVTFLWQQITKWEIIKEEGYKILIVHTAETAKKVNLSSLEMKPAEIEELLMKYKKM